MNLCWNKENLNAVVSVYVEVVTMTNDGAKITKNTLKLTQKTRWELAQKQSQ